MRIKRLDITGFKSFMDRTVVVFDEDTPRELISAVLPDILVKGADWTHFIAGRKEVEAAGGKVAILPGVPGRSTTNVLAKIAKG